MIRDSDLSNKRSKPNQPLSLQIHCFAYASTKQNRAIVILSTKSYFMEMKMCHLSVAILLVGYSFDVLHLLFNDPLIYQINRALSRLLISLSFVYWAKQLL